MSVLSKEEALAKLQRQLDQIDDLMRKPRFSSEFEKWHRDTEVAIERIFGQGTRHLADFNGISYSLMVFSPDTPDGDFEEAYRDGLESARSVLRSLIDEVQEYWGLVASESKEDALSIVEKLCSRFHLVARQIRARHDDRPTLEVEDEYDVQDLLHALLLLHFDDIRREEWTPSYAGGASRMDFLLKGEQVVVETKKSRKGLGAKEVGNQLLIDIQRYQSHPDCHILFCFVYDPEGRIVNPRGLERDLSQSHNGMQVMVLVAPKGT